MTAAKHRAVDLIRRKALHARKEEELTREIQAQLKEAAPPEPGVALDDPVRDDLLRLVFIACHPILSTDARVALTLRLLGGLTTAEIARAFLVSEPTIAQRIVRAKRTLAEARVPFEVPRSDELVCGSPRCSKSFIYCSTRVTLPLPATSGRDPNCATRRCALAASWPSLLLRSRKSTAWWR